MTGNNTGEASSRKREKRSSNPCDACRQRKSRCLTKDNSVICTMCELRNSACTFQNSLADRRHTRPATRAQSDVDDAHHLNNNMGRPTFVPESEAGWQTALNERNNTHGDEGDMSSTSVWDRTLGAETNRFAELYGLTSDAEPLLMVSSVYTSL
jgi:hypothetical protein